MKIEELEQLVEAVTQKRKLNGLRPHELVNSIHRRKFPVEFLSVIEPLLHMTNCSTYKYAIDIVGNMKGASEEAIDAIEAAWERSWEFEVPQACREAFRALLKIDGREQCLLRLVVRALEVDNYGIHKECAEALMKMQCSEELLTAWGKTAAGQCDCHLHRKLAEKIARHLESRG